MEKNRANDVMFMIADHFACLQIASVMMALQSGLNLVWLLKKT